MIIIMIIIFIELWLMFLLDYFLYLWSFVFACLFILSGLKVNILIFIKMSIESLKNKKSILLSLE